MSKLAQRQRNLANRQVNGHRRRFTVKSYTVKNVGTRKTVEVLATSPDHAIDNALFLGLAKSASKLVVVA